MAIDLTSIRAQFPILQQAIAGHPLVYLDNAATMQKPQAVLDAMDHFYKEDNANVHRGMHALAERATVAYENARATVQNFLHAKRTDEIIFVKSATEGINLVARSFAATHLREGDTILLTKLEHHSNIVPWLQLKEERGIEVQWIDIDDAGALRMDQLDRIFAEHRVKLVAVTGQSNVLGVRPDLSAIITHTHDVDARVLIDAAQLAGHASIDVQNLDCDFLVFSGHKVYGPTGIGVLYGKSELLSTMPPFLGGGMMIQEVFEDRFTPADPPAKFEAGTPAIAEAIGLATALEWLEKIPAADRAVHEDALLKHAVEQLTPIPGLRLLGPMGNVECGMRNVATKNYSKLHTTYHIPHTAYRIPHTPSGCLSFTLDNIHPHDLTHLLGEQGICLRAGHHCTQPLHRRLGINASSRLSVALYNTMEEIDRVAPAIMEIQKKFSRPHHGFVR